MRHRRNPRDDGPCRHGGAGSASPYTVAGDRCGCGTAGELDHVCSFVGTPKTKTPPPLPIRKEWGRPVLRVGPSWTTCYVIMPSALGELSKRSFGLRHSLATATRTMGWIGNVHVHPPPTRRTNPYSQPPP